MIDKEKKKIINRRKSKLLSNISSVSQRIQQEEFRNAGQKKKKKTLPAIVTSMMTLRPFQFAEVFVVPPSAIVTVSTARQCISGRPMLVLSTFPCDKIVKFLKIFFKNRLGVITAFFVHLGPTKKISRQFHGL